MIKFYCFLFLGVFYFQNSVAQNCSGAHSETMIPYATQNNVEFSYRITHCDHGDVVLLQITNNSPNSVNVTFIPKIFSANQVWESAAAINLNINAQSTITSPPNCSSTSSSTEFVGKEIFSNEYFPAQNSYPQILSVELLNINVN